MSTEQNDHPEKKNEDVNAELQKSNVLNTTSLANIATELKVSEKSASEENFAFFGHENHENPMQTDTVFRTLNAASAPSNEAFASAFFELKSTTVLNAFIDINEQVNENEFSYKHDFDLELFSETLDLSTTEVAAMELNEAYFEGELPTDFLETYEKVGWSLLKDHAYGL